MHFDLEHNLQHLKFIIFIAIILIHIIITIIIIVIIIIIIIIIIYRNPTCGTRVVGLMAIMVSRAAT